MLAGHTAIHVSNAIFQRGGMRLFLDEKLALAIPPLLSASPIPDCISSFGTWMAPKDSATFDPAETRPIFPSYSS